MKPEFLLLKINIELLRTRLQCNCIVMPSGCWEKTSTRFFPVINIDGEVRHAAVAALWVWRGIWVPPRQRKIVAMHHCDNPMCFNPWHVDRATQKRNVRDAQEKGRLRTRGRMTRCYKGHAYTKANTRWVLVNGYRYQACRTCLALRGHQYYARIKAARKSA